MIKDLMCPFFREPCLRERCAAFETKDKIGEGKWDKELHDVTYLLIKDTPYCATLNTYLPSEKE